MHPVERMCSVVRAFLNRTVGAKKNFPLRFGSTYFFFLSVTVGGAFPIFFLNVLRKRTVLR